MKEKKITGVELERLRKNADMFQIDLAKKLNVSEATIRNWESGRVEIPEKHYNAIGDIFEIDLGGKEQESNGRIIRYSPPKLYRIPVISWAKAGSLLDDFGANYGDLENQIDEHVHSEIRDPNAYALIVEGDSMEPRFFAGDVVITAPNYEARTGDFVVARFSETGRTLFKKFKRKGPEGNTIELISLNPEYKTIEFPVEAFRVIHPVVDVKIKLGR